MALKEYTHSVTGWFNTSSGVNVHAEVDERDSLITSINNSNGQDHIFESTHTRRIGGIANGPANGLITFDRCPLTYVDDGWNLANIPSLNSAIAATNPGRSAVQLPVFWLELRDIPGMIRQVGRYARWLYFNFPRPAALLGRLATYDIAALNLAIQFGWRPFVSDLWKLATLHDQVEKRRKELKTLYSKGLSRRVNLGSYTDNWDKSLTPWSTYGFAPTIPSKVVRTTTAWAVVRWKPSGAFPNWVPTDGQLRRILTGFTPDQILINIWEALPWSWLADWFTPIGASLKSMNHVLAAPVSATRMVRYESKRYFPPAEYNGGQCKISACSIRSWRNTRSIGGNNTTQASLPLLGANQLSILGSLAILGKRPRLS